MKFWGSRKQSRKSQHAGLSIEKLESRELMAVIPLISGQTATFQDADGTQVNVKLVGPGQGSIELVNGQLTGAGIDSLQLTGTSAASKLKISTRGGSVSGTTINDLVITKALNELGALRHLKAKSLDFIGGGHFVSDGSIHDVQFRSLGANAVLDVVGDVNRLKVDTLESGASVEVSGALREFVTQLLNSGTQVSAGQLDLLKVKQYANGTAVEVGQGGLAKAKIANIYYSAISSSGSVGEIHVTGDAFGTAVASNMQAGSDGKFGTIDDYVNDQSGTGSIGTVKLKGAVGAEGTYQEVNLVSSDTVGAVVLSRSAQQLGTAPVVWSEAASLSIPLSIEQVSASATGFDDDHIWIAIFGEEIATPAQGVKPPPAQNYYLDPTQLNGGVPVVQSTQPLVTSSNTPNLPLVPSFTLAQWKNASQAWGSNLAFPVPQAKNQFTGRILISAGAPVQAQVNQDAYHSVSAPSPANPTDPSSGTFYDFLEFTVTGHSSGIPSLDIDTSQVDSFGMPIKLQFFKDQAATQPINFTFNGTLNGTNVINDVTTIQTMVLGGLGTGQPVTGAGISAGSTIQSYDIVGQTITLNLVTGTNAQPVPLTAYAAGPVGVQAERDAIMSGATADALLHFLQNKLPNANARPFLQSAAPFQVSGPGPITGASISPATISTSSVGSLQANQVVTIAGVGGATNLNANFVVGIVTTGAFTLGGPTGSGAYTSGGTWSVNGGPTTPITGATNVSTAAIVIAAGDTSTLSMGDVVTITSVGGNTAANGSFIVASVVNSTTSGTFTLGSPVGNQTATTGGATWSVGAGPTTAITGATDGGEIVLITDSTTGLVNGNMVSVSGVEGLTAANGVFPIANVTPTSFTLAGSLGNVAYSGYGAWSMAITGASNPLSPTPGPIVITTTNTAGLQNGDLVEISGVEGYEGANGFFYISGLTPTSFKLDGSTGTGTYTSGGTWSVYAPAGRLVSPKDLVEALLSPQDSNSLNNYYNEVIDAFFLQYLPSTVTLPSGQTGGGQTFELHSAASGTNLKYSGIVTNSFTNNAGYVLRLIDLTGTDLNHYDIYYPFFTTNSPSPDVYTPLFTPLPPPSWITAADQQSESASQMIFACDAVFADNVARVGIDINASATAVLGDLEDSISAALNRGIALNAADTWGDTTQWYPTNGVYNYWVEYWHQTGLTYGDLAYAFPYDDKFGASTNLDVANVGLAQITLGGWSATATATTTAFQTPPASAAPGGQVTLSALVTGTSNPTGSVAFFINGVPINSNNYSSSPPVQPVPLNGSGIATITANLPSLPDGNDPHTYTVTAVYSGDTNNLPSIASYSLLQEDPIALALVPGSGVLGSTPQLEVTLPGTTYNGTIDFTVTRIDGSGGMSIGSIDVNAGTVVNNNQIIGDFPFLTSTFTGYTTGGAAGSNAITDISYPAPLVPNTQTISGTGIPASTSISTFTPAVLTLSAPAVANGAATIVANSVTINGTTIIGSTIFNVTSVANWTQGTVLVGQAVAGANFASPTTIASFTAASATMNNTTITTAASPVSISSVANLLTFTGYYGTTANTITGVSSIANIVPNTTLINGGGLTANSLMTGYAPVTLNLSKAALTTGPVTLTANGVTIWGTTTTGQIGVNVTTVDGWIPTTILDGKTITASAVGTLQLNTTVDVFTPATATFNNPVTASNSAITFTSNAASSALPVTATWTPTDGAAISSTENFGVT